MTNIFASLLGEEIKLNEWPTDKRRVINLANIRAPIGKYDSLSDIDLEEQLIDDSPNNVHTQYELERKRRLEGENATSVNNVNKKQTIIGIRNYTKFRDLDRIKDVTQMQEVVKRRQQLAYSYVDNELKSINIKTENVKKIRARNKFMHQYRCSNDVTYKGYRQKIKNVEKTMNNIRKRLTALVWYPHQFYLSGGDDESADQKVLTVFKGEYYCTRLMSDYRKAVDRRNSTIRLINEYYLKMSEAN